MTKIRLNSLDIITGLDTGNGIRMYQIVESGFVIARASDLGFEVLMDK